MSIRIEYKAHGTLAPSKTLVMRLSSCSGYLHKEKALLVHGEEGRSPFSTPTHKPVCLFSPDNLFPLSKEIKLSQKLDVSKQHNRLDLCKTPETVT